jgi:hypothetical protein
MARDESRNWCYDVFRTFEEGMPEWQGLIRQISNGAARGPSNITGDTREEVLRKIKRFAPHARECTESDVRWWCRQALR